MQTEEKNEFRNIKIETERLIIRNFAMTDEQDLSEYMLQRVNEKFEGYPGFTIEQVPGEIRNRTQSDEFFAIELKKDKKVIGNIYLGKRDFNTREMGYVLNKNYLNKGYGTEAGKAVITYSFQNGLHRIYAECSPENTASWKLMEKLGMVREAHLRKNVSFHNDSQGNPIYWDTYVYGILDNDVIK